MKRIYLIISLFLIFIPFEIFGTVDKFIDYGDLKWGFIDKTGKYVIQPVFCKENYNDLKYKEGLILAGCKCKDITRYYAKCYYDITGKQIIENVINTNSFHDGLARASLCKSLGDKLHPKACRYYDGFINKKGDFIIKPNFSDAQDFSEGLASVTIDENKREKHVFINKKGKIVLKTPYEFCGSFHEGFARIETKHRDFGYIDKSGKEVIYPAFAEAGDFSCGIACVFNFKDNGENRNYKFSADDRFDFPAIRLYGYINTKGEYISKPQFRYAYKFSDGAGMVVTREWGGYKYGYIDTAGNYIAKPQFDDAFSFSDGLALIKKNGKWGYIDKTGKIVIKPIYYRAGNFHEGLAFVKTKSTYGNYGYIDKTGKLVIPPVFDNAVDFSEGLASVAVLNGKTFQDQFFRAELITEEYRDYWRR